MSIPDRDAQVLAEEFRILVVGAQEADRAAVCSALREAPFAVSVEDVEDGRGLAKVQSGLFDCAFFEFKSAPKDGLKILREARAGGVEIPIVMLGVSGEIFRDQAKEAGASDYLDLTAFRPEALTGKLQALICGFRARSRLVAFPALAPIAIIEADVNGSVTYANPTAIRLFPDLEERGPAHGMLKTWGAATRALSSEERQSITREIRVDGLRYHQTIARVPGQPLFHIYAVNIKLAEEQLIRSADYDELTLLPNRKLFMDRLGRTLAREKRHQEQFFAVLFLNLDGFDAVNESHGAIIGDRLLKTIAERLGSCVRTEDTVARFDGDEFAALIESPRSLSDVDLVAERIRKKLKRPYPSDGKDVCITVSIGVALSETGYSNPEHLLRDAGSAMYHAKLDGGDRYGIFRPAAKTTEQMRTEPAGPIVCERLLLHYQPVISLHSGRLAGFHTLVRWQHPSDGLIEREAFCEDAEEAGALLAIDCWVLGAVMQHMGAWQARFSDRRVPAISISLSGQMLFSDAIRDIIRQPFEGKEVESSAVNLVIEIPTSAITSDLDSASELMASISSLGPRIAVDGFGKGPQFLGRLRQLPIDYLSISRSIVSEMASADNLRIVRSINDLTRTLGIELVATGIDTQEQFEAAMRVECDHAQGRRFGPPLTPEQAAELIAEDPHWPVDLAKPAD